MRTKSHAVPFGLTLRHRSQSTYAGLILRRNQFSEVAQDIGCAVGSLFVFFFGETIGRKRMIMAGASTMIVGTVRPLHASELSSQSDEICRLS